MLITTPDKWRDKGLGRIKSIDPGDQNFLMAHLLQLEGTPHPTPWQLRNLLDQGNEGSCTGFGSAHFLQAAPYMHKLTYDFARGIYLEARRNDEWPGEDYEGSSVRGAMKAMVKLGLITGSYVWAWDLETMKRHLLYRGPVVIGVSWYAGMMSTDAKGFITPIGGVVGGHCVCVTYYSSKKDYFLGPNNWGTAWGKKGWWRMRGEHMQHLIEQDGGEVASAVEVRKVS
jgi:hypothetical protein